ncbi:hypothetical protein [Novosphingobium terrae]|jgi:hypothetical protein|uniref:hypothetical protein n=1 Tax=Novosphingobium terrae TaxID=2726189 RepID=UPI00197FB069|nr:hypothetical protein [Novosphingobium terrae]
MRKSLLGIVGLMLTAASPATLLTPTAIQSEIRSEGAKAVVNRLYNSGAYDKVVMSKIRSGNVQWILLARPLSAGTDAATSEGLTQALIYALPKSPQAVLSVIDLSGSSYPRSPGEVCSASFFEGAPTNIPAYRAAAVRSVKAVTVPSLQAAKQICLKRLRAKG